MHERDILIQLGGKQTIVNFLEGFNGEVNRSLQRKLIQRDRLQELGEFLSRQGIKKAFTTGAFDMIHRGHIRYLELARSLGDALVVGLNSDESIRDYKGPNRPILDEEARAEVLSYLMPVDYITIYPELNGAEVIRLLRPDAYLCVEGMWEGDISTKEEVQAMVEVGGEIYYTPRQDPFLSTSAIIGRIEKLHGQKILSDFQRLVQEGS